MSILHSILRFIDPIQHRQQEQDKRRKREVTPPEADGDEVVAPPPRPPGARVPLLRCRVCRYQAETRHPFCPRCLAETMERPR
jgi:hypothetical protein